MDSDVLIFSEDGLTVTGVKDKDIEQVTIPDGAVIIGHDAFRDCTSLKNIDIPNSVIEFGWLSFCGCTSLQSIEIPDSVTVIAYGAFMGCTSLQSINIPDKIEYISNNAFNSCKSLKRIYINKNVKKIEPDFFYSCDNLQEIIVDNRNTEYDSRDNCNAIIHTKSNTLLLGCGYTIIPNGVKSIADYAFNNNKKLTSIFIPASVRTIGANPFLSCDNLSVVKVDENNKIYDSRNECDAIIHTKTNKLIVGCKDSIIPNDVKEIGEKAFYDISSLQTINIPKSVETIGSGAFRFCNNLKYVDIPNGVVEIKEDAFSSCSSLESIDLPNTLKDIGAEAFASCWSLKYIVIPDSVKSLGDGAFDHCWSLRKLVIPKNVNKIGSGLIIGASMDIEIIVDEENKNYDSRYDCNAVIRTKTNELIIGCANTIIPDDVKSIGEKAFYECFYLVNIEIPEGVKKIGDSAFANCGMMEEISVPKSARTFGKDAFKDCNSLKSIHIYLDNIEKVRIGNDTFDENIYNNTTLYVPPGTRWEYRHHPVFGKFKNIEIERE